MSFENLTIISVGFTVILLSILSVSLLGLLVRSQTQNRSLLLELLAEQVSENQSLRNQLRAGDPMTLHSLNHATNQNSTSDEDYVPTHDEALVYERNLRNSEFHEEGLDHDLDAAGWENITVRDTGGTPVKFDRVE